MNNKNFYIMLIGQIISIIGSAIQRCSLSLYILDTTQSVGAFSTALALSMIPYVLLAPFAGSWADSFNKKYSLVLFDFLSGGISLLYAGVLFMERDNNLVIVLVMMALSTVATFYNPVVTASIPSIVKKDSLVRANGIIQQVGSISNFLGPVLAGVIYGLFGIKVIILLNGISFVLSAVMEMFLVMPHKRGNKTGKKGNVIKDSLKDMGSTFVYLREENRVVLSIIATFSIHNFFLIPVFSILYPYIIKSLLKMSAGFYGIAEGILAVGMMAGGMMVVFWPKAFSVKGIYKVLLVMSLSLGSVSFVFGGFNSRMLLVTALVAGCTLVMAALGCSNVILLTFIQQKVKEGKLGKVSAFSTAAATLCIPAGQLLFGRALEGGVQIWQMFLVSAVINLGITIFIKQQTHMRKERV